MATGDQTLEIFDSFPRTTDEGTTLFVRCRHAKDATFSDVVMPGQHAYTFWIKSPTAKQLADYAYGKTVVVPCPVPASAAPATA